MTAKDRKTKAEMQRLLKQIDGYRINLDDLNIKISKANAEFLALSKTLKVRPKWKPIKKKVGKSDYAKLAEAIMQIR